MSIAVVDDMEHERFVVEHQIPRRPFVWRGGALSVARDWSFDELRRRVGDQVVEFAGGEGHTTLSDYLEALEAREVARGRLRPPRARGAAQVFLPYLRNIFLSEQLPQLVDDVTLPFFVDDNWLSRPPLRDVMPLEWRRWIEFFVSGSGMRFPFIHADTHQTHAWIAQIVGEKRAWLWPPRYRTQAARLKDNLISVEVDDDTDLTVAMGHSAPAVVDFGAGDLLFIPAGWWHTVEAQSLSVTVSGNFVNASNWDDFYAFHQMAMQVADDEALRALGAAVVAFAPDGVFPEGGLDGTVLSDRVASDRR